MMKKIESALIDGSDARDRMLWMVVFFGLLAGYCFCYAPWGINETDGGFLTGLAWQVLSGKTLYQDVIYVRPPLPVWLRAIEMHILPEHWAVLGERWIFYLKVGLYSWCGAAVLASAARRWMLAAFGFVVSVHCYPPMAWHTVDGILFSVLGIWCVKKIPWSGGAVLAGVSICAALLCKQSFYPIVAVFAGMVLFDFNLRKVIFTRLYLPNACVIFWLSRRLLKITHMLVTETVPEGFASMPGNIMTRLRL